MYKVAVILEQIVEDPMIKAQSLHVSHMSVTLNPQS